MIRIDGQLVVMKKSGGPYRNRYDLPGGSLDGPEPLDKTVLREVREETGLTCRIDRQLGAVSFVYPWAYKRWNLNQHLCIFYSLTAEAGGLLSDPVQFQGQDTLGALLMPPDSLTLANSSPLVLWAARFLTTGTANLTSRTFQEWPVLERPVWN
ncbi:NUDIX domain-containing protein [Lacticaseibacillus yichunensis]|uniref:NUDIX domain-containing protein n=1 Tax=Lacticaseibacillus yichunensis TaxID=2486015 RepID=A0ABW4CSJ9_9LACO|nr:NUDIX hydrolase [Lacticaseibacillus yichunensis]